MILILTVQLLSGVYKQAVLVTYANFSVKLDYTCIIAVIDSRGSSS